MTVLDMELALVTFFDYRRNLIVPNVGDGLFLHECDLLILTKAGYAYEVEIKTTKADLIRDKKKGHGHHSNKIKYLYFAVPEPLLNQRQHIPERAGIISVEQKEHLGRKYEVCSIVKPPTVNCIYRFSDSERLQLARLGALRIWGLKRRISDIQKPFS